jgi:hypothetical protein
MSFDDEIADVWGSKSNVGPENNAMCVNPRGDKMKSAVITGAAIA